MKNEVIFARGEAKNNSWDIFEKEGCKYQVYREDCDGDEYLAKDNAIVNFLIENGYENSTDDFQNDIWRKYN